MTSLDHLISACAYLDEHRDCVPSIEADPSWLPEKYKGSWVANVDKHPTKILHPLDVVRKSLAECIITSAVWTGWSPPECKSIFGKTFVCNREVGHSGLHAFFPRK